jgi:hypothetical protein
MNRKATGIIDQWIPLAELAELFGLSNKNGANAGQVRVVSATEPCAKNESRISCPVDHTRKRPRPASRDRQRL